TLREAGVSREGCRTAPGHCRAGNSSRKRLSAHAPRYAGLDETSPGFVRIIRLCPDCALLRESQRRDCVYGAESWLSLTNPSFFNSAMRDSSLRFLRTLVNTPSPVGHEVRGQRVWLDYARKFADETFSDAYGNCVAVLNKGGSPRLMLAGHADEIAMSVNYINDDGFIYVRKMGGVNAAITKAQRVIIHSSRGNRAAVKGVVGNVAPHLMKEEKDQ